MKTYLVNRTSFGFFLARNLRQIAQKAISSDINIEALFLFKINIKKYLFFKYIKM